MSKICEGLNDAQRDAVETLTGPVLILAGAGSGKTKTLTHRIANLIEQGVSPYEILALTFTNKAAREMRERLAGLLGMENSFSFMPWMGTFHSICVKILRIEAANVGLSSSFTIYDSDDRLALIKRAMKELKISDKTLKPRAAESAISKAKNEGKDPSEYAAEAFYPQQRNIAEGYERYEDMRMKADAVDFDDLLLYVAKMLKQRVDLRAKWRAKFKHILIDADIPEGYRGGGMVENLLQDCNIFKSFIMMIAKSLTECVRSDFFLYSYFFASIVDDFIRLLPSYVGMALSGLKKESIIRHAGDIRN